MRMLRILREEARKARSWREASVNLTRKSRAPGDGQEFTMESRLRTDLAGWW